MRFVQLWIIIDVSSMKYFVRLALTTSNAIAQVNAKMSFQSWIESKQEKTIHVSVTLCWELNHQTKGICSFFFHIFVAFSTTASAISPNFRFYLFLSATHSSAHIVHMTNVHFPIIIVQWIQMHRIKRSKNCEITSIMSCSCLGTIALLLPLTRLSVNAKNLSGTSVNEFLWKVERKKKSTQKAASECIPIHQNVKFMKQFQRKKMLRLFSRRWTKRIGVWKHHWFHTDWIIK